MNVVVCLKQALADKTIIVGDLFEIVPLLSQEFKKRLA